MKPPSRTANTGRRGERAEDRVFNAILDAVLDHRLAPGTKLTERELTEIFGASRGAVRAALSRLGHSLLVEQRPHRGARPLHGAAHLPHAAPRPRAHRAHRLLRRARAPRGGRGARAPRRAGRDAAHDRAPGECRAPAARRRGAAAALEPRRGARHRMRRFAYFAPTTLDEAVALLGRYDGKASVLAGGTDLLVEIKEQLRRPDQIIDIKKIPAMAQLAYHPDHGLKIGALVTTRQIETSPIVLEKYPGLAQAVRELGSIQIRNRATLAGNVCRASPSADTLPPLIADS